jgi:hypothetical protein
MHIVLSLYTHILVHVLSECQPSLVLFLSRTAAHANVPKKSRFNATGIRIPHIWEMSAAALSPLSRRGDLAWVFVPEIPMESRTAPAVAR